jgi:hypothetical protein
LEQQAEENIADSYAVYLALGALIEGPQGQLVLEMLGHRSIPPADADVILVSALLLSAFSFFSAKSSVNIDPKTIYTLTHPPAYARINAILQTTKVWCQQFRPHVDASLTYERLEAIWNAEESSRPGSEGFWARQIEFFLAPDGTQYFKCLAEQISRIRKPGVTR